MQPQAGRRQAVRRPKQSLSTPSEPRDLHWREQSRCTALNRIVAPQDTFEARSAGTRRHRRRNSALWQRTGNFSGNPAPPRSESAGDVVEDVRGPRRPAVANAATVFPAGLDGAALVLPVARRWPVAHASKSCLAAGSSNQAWHGSIATAPSPRTSNRPSPQQRHGSSSLPSSASPDASQKPLQSLRIIMNQALTTFPQ